MRRGGDERGQAIQVGAIVLFAFLVLAFAGYQAVLVPQQNAAVEHRHSAAVAADLVDLRTAIVEAWSVGGTRSATVRLGTTYPPRVLAVNPPAPAGTLRTGTAGEVTVAVTTPNGSTTLPVCGAEAVPTRALSYAPEYNEFRDAPAVIYENSVVYRRYDDEVLFGSDQRLVRNATVNLVTLATPYEASGGTARSIDLVPGTRTNRTVTLDRPVERLRVTVPSALSADDWRSLLPDDRVHHVGRTGERVSVTLAGPPNDAGSRTYTVVCRPVGLDRPP